MEEHPESSAHLNNRTPDSRNLAAPIAKTLAPPESTFRFDIVKLNVGGKVMGREVKQGRYFTEDLGGGVSIDMVVIPAGKFLMGAHETEQKEYPDEGPQHEVTLKRFYMSKYEVTQADWRAVAAHPKVTRDLNPEPSKFKGDDLPVENISWEEAVEFCERLSKKSGRVYHLPSESEWEYAARAGSATAFAFGETVTAELANYDGTAPYGLAEIGVSRERTIPVGSRARPTLSACTTFMGTYGSGAPENTTRITRARRRMAARG